MCIMCACPPSFRADDAPSKVWPISAGTTVSDVQAQQYNLRHKHTSTLMAVARGEGGPCVRVPPHTVQRNPRLRQGLPQGTFVASCPVLSEAFDPGLPGVSGHRMPCCPCRAIRPSGDVGVHGGLAQLSGGARPVEQVLHLRAVVQLGGLHAQRHIVA